MKKIDERIIEDNKRVKKKRNELLDYIIGLKLWASQEVSQKRDIFGVKEFLQGQDHRRLTEWFDHLLVMGFNEDVLIFEELLEKIVKGKEEAIELGTEFDTEREVRSEKSIFVLKTVIAKEKLEKFKEEHGSDEGTWALGNKFLLTHKFELCKKVNKALTWLLDELDKDYETFVEEKMKEREREQNNGRKN